MIVLSLDGQLNLVITRDHCAAQPDMQGEPLADCMQQARCQKCGGDSGQAC